jgi:hypothetical protein
MLEAGDLPAPSRLERLLAEGLAFEDGPSALLRDEVAGFARACVVLLFDPRGRSTWGIAQGSLYLLDTRET